MLMSKLEWDQSRLRHATIQTCKVPKGQTHLNLSILSSLVLKAMSPQTDLFSYTSSEIPELIFWWGKAQFFKLFHPCLPSVTRTSFLHVFYEVQLNFSTTQTGFPLLIVGYFPCGPFSVVEILLQTLIITLLEVRILCAIFLLILMNKNLMSTPKYG